MPGSGRADRTRRAVLQQLEGMGCAQYEVGIRNRQTGQLIPRCWTPDEVKDAVRYLQYMNARGNDIYIRPVGSAGLLLVDDLTSAAVSQMKRDGIPPALVVETSPGNYQAWVRLSQSPVSSHDATAAAKVLASRYGGDPNSADWRHYGRLAGYTNQKPEHRRPDGQQPYVLLSEASGATATDALAELLQTAAKEQSAATARGTVPRGEGRADDHLGPPGANYTRRARRLLDRYPNTDYSRLDWMVLRDIASSSLAVDREYLERALLEGSPRLQERKVGHIEDYVRHTAQKVLQDAGVIAARAQLARGDEAPGVDL